MASIPRAKIPKEVKFNCIRCTRCCRERKILLLPEDVERLARATGLSVRDFAVPVEGLEPYKYRLKKPDGACIFLKGDKCTVYSYRPSACRFYPFVLFHIGMSYVFIIAGECPGLGKGPELEQDFFEKYLSWFRTWKMRVSKRSLPWEL